MITVIILTFMRCNYNKIKDLEKNKERIIAYVQQLSTQISDKKFLQRYRAFIALYCQRVHQAHSQKVSKDNYNSQWNHFYVIFDFYKYDIIARKYFTFPKTIEILLYSKVNQQIMQRMNQFDKFRLMNSFNPNPLKYLLYLQRNLQYGWSNNVVTPSELSNLLNLQNKVLLDQKQIITNRIRIELILNYVSLLSAVLNDSYRQEFAKNELIKEKYKQIVQIAILKIKQGDINDDCKPIYATSYKIFQYLLKYSKNQEQQLQILKQILEFVKISGCKNYQKYSYIARKFPDQTGLKNQLKIIAHRQKGQSHAIKQVVLNILAEVNLSLKKKQF